MFFSSEIPFNLFVLDRILKSGTSQKLFVHLLQEKCGGWLTRCIIDHLIGKQSTTDLVCMWGDYFRAMLCFVTNLARTKIVGLVSEKPKT